MEERERVKYAVSLLRYLMKKEREEMQIPATVSSKESIIREVHDIIVNRTGNIY